MLKSWLSKRIRLNQIGLEMIKCSYVNILKIRNKAIKTIAQEKTSSWVDISNGLSTTFKLKNNF